MLNRNVTWRVIGDRGILTGVAKSSVRKTSLFNKIVEKG
jgi:hypothetical protein